MRKPHDRNLGKNPADPDYIDDYNYEEELDIYEDYLEEQYQLERENNI